MKLFCETLRLDVKSYKCLLIFLLQTNKKAIKMAHYTLKVPLFQIPFQKNRIKYYYDYLLLVRAQWSFLGFFILNKGGQLHKRMSSFIFTRSKELSTSCTVRAVYIVNSKSSSQCSRIIQSL